MKIAFPVMEDHGLESPVHNHFGSAAYFVLADTQTNTVTRTANPDQEHLHGQCQPLRALGGNQVDALEVGGIGRGALQKLGASGIKTYRAIEGTVKENLELLKKGHLPEFTVDQTCAGHATPGACGH